MSWTGALLRPVPTLVIFTTRRALSATLDITMITLTKRHFLQSHEWALFQQKLGKKVFEKQGKGWRYIAIVEKGDGKVGRYFNRLYTPYGPSYDSAQALDEALADLEKLAKENNIDYVRVEPLATNGLAPKQFAGYSKMPKSYQPGLTWMLDLAPGFEAVKSGIHRSSRYRWNRVERDGITFAISYEAKDLNDFIEMMGATSDRTKAQFRDGEYYRKMLKELGPSRVAGIAYAKHENESLVGVLFLDDLEAQTRYYMYTGAFDKARKFGANAPLVVFLIRDAIEKGLTCFDFFGIAPAEDPSHKWAGFSVFKRSFGGVDIEFSGTWEKAMKPVKYKAMVIARKFG